MVIDTIRVCYCVLTGRRHPPPSETPYEPREAGLMPKPLSL